MDNKIQEKPQLQITANYLSPTQSRLDHLDQVLRTYATWLVRAARRKMADSGPENTPKNNPENGSN